MSQSIHGSNLAITLLRDGVPLATSFDIDCCREVYETRHEGSYIAKVALPSAMLKAGHYSINVSAGKPNIQKFEAHADVLAFELHDNIRDRHHL